MCRATQTPGVIANEAALAYIIAGESTVTLVSETTGARFTYTVNQLVKGKGEAQTREPLWFVRVLSGPDNTNDYTYLGCVVRRGGRLTLITTAKSPADAADRPSFRALAWAISRLSAGQPTHSLQVWHDGRCGRCGRHLTTPESVERGLGPICAQKGA